MFRAPFTAFDTIRDLLGMGVAGMAFGFGPWIYSFYSLIVGLSYERSEVVQCYEGVCQKFCNTVYRGSFWCI